MYEKNFLEARKRIGIIEGGYSNRNIKDDPGGETNWGISKRSYPHLDIKSLTYDDATTIFYNDFYLKPKFNLIDDVELVFVLMDFAVHSGPYNAIVKAQEVLAEMFQLGSKFVDGKFGPNTLSQLKKADRNKFIYAYILKRWSFLQTLKNYEANKNGWFSRMKKVLDYTGQSFDPIQNELQTKKILPFVIGAVGVFLLFNN